MGIPCIERASWVVVALLVLCRATPCFAGASTTRLTECPTDGPNVTYRWTSDDSSLYVEGGGCVTPSDIWRDAPDTPVIPVNATTGEEVSEETGTWMMTKNLFIESDTTLLLYGDLGCEEFRLESSSTNALQLRGFGAYISLLKTKVFSWSSGNAAYDTGSSKGENPRSHITVLSEMIYEDDDCDGSADDDAGEARLDIINSEVGYLGYQGAEAYGITFKVRGYCEDGTNPEVFDRVNVRGDIRFSDIHHNWFGMYSYGHQDGLWEHNLMHDCGYYGFDPHDDSDNLRIHDNVVYDNGNHGIIASKRCNDVSIQNNVVYDNKEHGIMLHRSSDNGIIRNNTVTGSGSACIALFESFGIEVSNNTCDGNFEGIRLSLGSADNKIFDNDVVNTSGRAIWLYKGSDAVDASDFVQGRNTDNLFQNNYVESAEYGVNMQESDAIQFIGNTFIDTDENQFQDVQELLWQDNEVNSDFAMDMSDTCMASGSDLEQVAAAGGVDTEC